MKERALVLGGGGPVGIAWESGIAAGLAQAGVAVARADFILGTSAGSFVGAQLAGGRDPQSLAEAQIALGRKGGTTRQAQPAGPAPDLAPLMAYMARRPRDGFPDQALLAEIGAFARAAKTISEAQFLEGFGGIVNEGHAWPARFACTAVDAEDGAFKLWTADDGVPLGRGVASSCCVPGIFPPIAIKDRLWIDGGMRSGTNADLAAGHARVLIVAVAPPAMRDLMMPGIAREMKAIEAAGGRCALITPDAASGETFGANLMNASRRAEITEAGIAQGRAEAERLASFWN